MGAQSISSTQPLTGQLYGFHQKPSQWEITMMTLLGRLKRKQKEVAATRLPDTDWKSEFEFAQLISKDLAKMYLAKPGQIYPINDPTGFVSAVAMKFQNRKQPCIEPHKEGDQVLGSWIAQCDEGGLAEASYCWVPISDRPEELMTGDGWKLAMAWKCSCGNWQVTWDQSPLVLLAHLALMSNREVADGGVGPRHKSGQVAGGDSLQRD